MVRAAGTNGKPPLLGATDLIPVPAANSDASDDDALLPLALALRPPSARASIRLGRRDGLGTGGEALTCE
eukprot:SAG11_NODE_12599_length_695_cov_0.947987_1_plen_70_part_00